MTTPESSAGTALRDRLIGLSEVGLALCAASMLWLPGHSHASAVRTWFVLGVLPLWAASRSMGGATPRSHALPWLALAALSLASAPLVAQPGAAVAVALTQLGWAAGLLLGLGTRADTLAPWVALCGAGAAFLPSYGNTDLRAGFVALAALWTADLVRRPAWRDRLFGAAMGAAQAVGLWQCGSLGGVLVLAAGVWAALFARGGRARWVAIAAGVAALAASLGLDTIRDHLAGRFYLARLSLFVAGEAFPWGVGPGQLHAAFLEAQAAAGGDPARWTNAYHAHAEPLHLLAEQGPMGLLLGLLPFASALLRPRAGPAWRSVVACAALGWVSLPLYDPGSAFLVTLSVGLCLRRPDTDGAAGGAGSPPSGPSRRWAAAALLPLALATTDLLADRLLMRGVHQGDPATLAASAALSLRPARALQHEAEARLPVDPDAALALAHDAARRNPSPEAWSLVGRCAEAADLPDAAIAAYTEAARLHPRLFAAHFNLALLHEWRGDRATARRHAERARSLRPGDPRLVRLPR